MFVSLKWKALLFLSVTLISITLFWVGLNVYGLIKSYNAEVETLSQKHQEAFDQLMNDNFLRLSQFAQLISREEGIRESSRFQGAGRLNQYLRQQWIELNISIGLDYLAVFDADGIENGSVYNERMLKDIGRLNSALEDIRGSSAFQGPESFLYCEEGCLQFVVEPIIFNDGSQGAIVLGQNMSDMLVRYKNLTGSDIAVLLKKEIGSQDIESERFLPELNSVAWAVSSYAVMMPVLKNWSHDYDLDLNNLLGLHSYAGSQYLFQSLEKMHLRPMGDDVDFVAISDKSKQYAALMQSIIGGMVTGLLALIVSELSLIFLMLGPLKRLLGLTSALNFLPQHEYKKARIAVSSGRSYFTDELSMLERSVYFVSRELEDLHRDVEKKKQELNEQINILTRSRSFLERLINNSHLFILTQDLNHRILSSNTRFEDVFGDEKRGFLDVFSHRHFQDDFIDLVSGLGSTTDEAVKQETELLSINGDPIVVDWTHSLVDDEVGGKVILSIGMDLTKRKKDEKALEWLANNDTLTKIGNRRAFHRDLEYVLDAGMEGAVVFIDVNRFKQINDLYGHAVGDQVLIQIADTLKENVRANDSISRLAGDEFTIIFQKIDRANLEMMLTKLASALNGRVVTDEGQKIEYSVSLGASLIPEHGHDEQTLVVNADLAMYQAKKKGLNLWHIYTPDDNNLSTVQKEHDLTGLIKKALTVPGFFNLAYQPIMNLDDSSVSHYEVLLRLTGFDGNPVFPDEFIPAAERIGLIRQIDSWVVQTALKRLSYEQLKGRKISFSINISTATIQSKEFPEILCSRIAEFGLNPESVIIELTETAYIENFDLALKNLNLIAKAGIKIALDDFGVGFFSFNYLKLAPLSYVKLDGSYVKNLRDNKQNQIFLECLSRIVNGFGMQTIAEFVEDEWTINELKRLGVDYGQGYYIGKPLPEVV
ncbi:EAL domain-containing protein [Thiomicrorhabdus sp. ZW0627]|uniref:bifunctional diguanylate cyclase/phosphodiesterase n=1 Tax=Thiomicrorhabdus sp. ZW0627 TaxID=3039774 RepID=UPI0024368E9B|nr:EAL domain-containing protein [Thiomicrorhabdus sp. ZW0627]MDG6774828.1 EAL domain-containing protein [Thiomicrorhabdus sp. ZW0627]